MLGGELGGERFHRALRIEHLAGADARQLQLDGQGLREQLRIALGHARAAAPAHPDLADAQRLQRPQCIARDDAAHPEAARDLLFGAEEVAGLQAFDEQRLAHIADDPRRQRCLASGDMRLRPPALACMRPVGEFMAGRPQRY